MLSLSVGQQDKIIASEASGTTLKQCLSSAALRVVLRVLQHPGLQFWGPAIGGSGKIFMCCI